MSVKRVSLNEYRRIVKDGAADSDLVIVARSGGRSLGMKSKGASEKERRIPWVISDGSVDRSVDTINVNGWDLKSFEANEGPVLYGHNHGLFPAGKVVPGSTKVKGKKLVSIAEFAPEPSRNHPLAVGDLVFELAKLKILNSASVGFRPLKSRESERVHPAYGWKGIDFIDQELLEWSVVPVPDNPNSLQGAKENGLDLSPIREYCEVSLDNKDYLVVPKSALEEAWKIAGGNKVSVSGGESGRDDEGDRGVWEFIKGAISFDEAHEGGSSDIDRDGDWDASVEVGSAETEAQLVAMHAWITDSTGDDGGEDNDDGDDEDELNKDAYKLPHHTADGTLNFAGLVAATAALSGLEIPEGEIEVVAQHLIDHYGEFDEEAPDVLLSLVEGEESEENEENEESEDDTGEDGKGNTDGVNKQDDEEDSEDDDSDVVDSAAGETIAMLQDAIESLKAVATQMQETMVQMTEFLQAALVDEDSDESSDKSNDDSRGGDVDSLKEVLVESREEIKGLVSKAIQQALARRAS